MAETRSKAQMKEATMREVEEALGARIEAMNEKLEKSVADMFEAICLLTLNKGNHSMNDESNTARSTPEDRTPSVPTSDLIIQLPNQNSIRGTNTCISDTTTWHQSIVQSELGKNRFQNQDTYRAYLAGLRTDTQMHVRMFHPRSIHQCLLVGRFYETTYPLKQSPILWSSSEIINNGETKENMEEATMGDDQTQQQQDSESAHISVDGVAGISYYTNIQTA